MGLQTIKTIIRRLFTDAEFRARALADPSAALADYPLAPIERQVLTELCRRLASGRGIEVLLA